MTDVPLRQYIEQRFNDLDRRLDAELKARDQALDLARADINRRLAEMNELRQQINSERGHFITRELYDRMEAERNRGLSSIVGWLVGGAGVLVAFAALLLSL